MLTVIDNKIQQKPFSSQRDITTSTHDFPDPCIYLLNQFGPFILEATENLTQIIRRIISSVQVTRKFRTS